MTAHTALLATLLFGTLIALSVVGDAVTLKARDMFDLPRADFTAKFVKP